MPEDKENPKKCHEKLIGMRSDKKNDFIFYKGKRIIHRKILDEYLKQYTEE